MLCLHRKSTQELVFLPGRNGSQNIFRTFHFQRQSAIGFFYFLIRNGLWAVICHCCSHDYNILFCKCICNSLIHLFCRNHRNCIYKKRLFKAGRSGDQCYLCPSSCRILCQCITHFSSGMVGHITYRVNCLLGGSCCDENLLSCQVFLTGSFLQNIF